MTLKEINKDINREIFRQTKERQHPLHNRLMITGINCFRLKSNHLYGTATVSYRFPDGMYGVNAVMSEIL